MVVGMAYRRAVVSKVMDLKMFGHWVLWFLYLLSDYLASVS